MKTIILSFFLLFSIILIAQENNVIKGNVSNKNKDFLIGASVLLYSKKDTTKIVDYSITNENGEFSIKIENKENKFLTVSYLGYELKKTNLIKDLKYYKIILSESQNSLNEVVIKASKYRDTVRLKNDTIKFSKNTKLKDLLKDNKSIEITDENGIKFMGVPINKILINKKEVFVNQNSLALENITNEMIDNIQVINNYKDKFNVDFDNFNEMVLNIDVKNKFKGILKNIIELGLGIKKAYTLKWKSFLFSDKINIFLTQNTNSILDKSKNKNEIVNRQNNSSSFYNNNVTSIVQGFKEVKEDLYNNTYLLIKKENKKSKIETNIGFNYSKQELDNLILIDENQNQISEESTLNKRNGNMFYADFGLINLISKDFSINLFSNVDFVDNNLNWTNNKTIFPTSTFSNNTLYNSNNFILKNTINLKKIFNQKWLWENSIDYVYENTENDFSNSLDLTSINQNIIYRNKQFNASSSLFYQKSNLFNYGIKIDFSNMNESIISQVNLANFFINRDFKEIESSIIVKGQSSKWNYFTTIGTQLYLFKNNNAIKTTLPISTSFNYKFSSKKSINLSYENNYEIENLENSLDSLFVNSTTLITSNDISRNIQQTQIAVFSYNISNIAKSKSISFLVAGSKDNNFSQNSLTNFNSNINTFQKGVFDKRKTLFLKHSYSKGYYYSKKDHELQLGYKISSSFLESEVIRNNVLQPLYTEQFDVGLNFALIPQKMFFTELALKTNYSKSNIAINDLKINSIGVNKNTLSISKSDGNHIYSMEFYNERYKSETEIINRNDLNISYRFYFNKKTSFFIKGKNTINLLNIRKNTGNLITNSINGLNITTINNNTFGYLIAGIQFKL